MGRVLRYVYTGYAGVLFVLLFLIFFLLLLLPIANPRWYNLVGVFNRWWAWVFFTLIGLRWSVEVRGKLDPHRQYVFCPNHFSYLDIPVMGLNPHNAIFVGKNDMENIPLFGFMYRKLHITVDREKLRSRFNVYRQSFKAIDEGKSLVIYPEGGILTVKDPVMARFKEGAFRIAIDKQIPVVPVTLPFNWIILPPEEFLLRHHRINVILHEPIETRGLTVQDTDTLKEKVYAIIDSELKQHLT